jgi:hypothetical protein
MHAALASCHLLPGSAAGKSQKQQAAAVLIAAVITCQKGLELSCLA